jgi:Flp pilus assembly pilin Flp
MLNRFRNRVVGLHKDISGQGLVEYALIMALVVFAAVGTMKTLATDINSAFVKITDTLNSALGS